MSYLTRTNVDQGDIQRNDQQAKKDVEEIAETVLEGLLNDPARDHLMVKKWENAKMSINGGQINCLIISQVTGLILFSPRIIHDFKSKPSDIFGI
jgi:hypothetical protein